MADPIFERYKEALRAGHVAALRGRLDDALVQYRAAAAIAPDRPLPHVGMADALLLLGRIDDALVSSRMALQRAPADPAGLEVAARVQEAAGQKDGAAALLDRLADALAEADSLDGAHAAAVRARDLSSTDARRRRAEELAAARNDALGALSPEPGPGQRTGSHAPEIASPAATSPAITAPVAAVSAAGSAAADAAAADVVPIGAEPAASAGEARPVAAPEGARETGDAAVETEPAPATEALSVEAEPAPASEAPPGGPDPEAAFAAADVRAAAGDPSGAAALYVQAAEACLSMGAPRSAVDECLRALAGAPGDTDVHLELARIHVASGRAERAADTLDLLERLLILDGDADGLARVEAFRHDPSPAPATGWRPSPGPGSASPGPGSAPPGP